MTRGIEASGVGSAQLILVDDGSRDDTPKKLRVLCEQDARVRAVHLSRNFGKEIALTAGLDHADGDAVIFLDADLQHPPALIPEFVARWRDGAEVVIGVRGATEKKSFMRSLGSRLYHTLMKRLGEVETVPGETDFRLLDRRVCEAVRRVGEHQRLFRGVVNWVGFDKTFIPFDAPPRHSGEPTYTFGKLWNLALDSFVGHSQAPLRFVFHLGILALILSTLGLVWMTCAELLFGTYWHYTPLAKAVVFNTALVAVLQISVGIVGLYVSKIYREVLGRPLYVVRTVIGGDAKRDEVLSVSAARHD